MAMSPLRRIAITLFWGALIFAYSSAILPGQEAPTIFVWDKLNHMLAFFTITVLYRMAYPRVPVLRILLAMIAFGALIELSQAIPMIHRDAEWDDWFADIFATLIGLIIAWPLAILADKRRERRGALIHSPTE